VREEGYAYSGRSRVPATHGESTARQGAKAATNAFARRAEIVYWPRPHQRGCFRRFPQPRLVLLRFVVVSEVLRRRLNRYSVF